MVAHLDGGEHGSGAADAVGGGKEGARPKRGHVEGAQGLRCRMDSEDCHPRW